MAATASVSAAVTLCVALLPGLRFAYRAQGLHVALESVAALVALLAAFLVLGRLRRGRSARDLLLTCGLATLALANLCFGALPAAVQARPSVFATWAAASSRSAGALLVCLAAFAATRPLGRRVRVELVAVAGAAATVAAIAVVLAAVSSRLPLGVTLAPELSARPRLEGHPGVLAIQVFVAAAFALAAVGFARRAADAADRFLGWLAAACVLHAFSSINYFLYPSLYSEWVYTGDAFRLAFYVVLLTGAALEIASYWRAAAALAVLDERRRIAREFHDGVAQELAYIERAAALLGEPVADGEAGPRIRAAARRALDESRRAIATLAREPGGSDEAAFAQLLERAVRETAARYGAVVSVDVVAPLEVDGGRAHALVRIATEAVANAIRHGGADTVELELAPVGERVRLRVVDRGLGFDPQAVRRDGFGLTSMRERAVALGGELRLESRPGEGTVVEAEL